MGTRGGRRRGGGRLAAAGLAACALLAGACGRPRAEPAVAASGPSREILRPGDVAARWGQAACEQTGEGAQALVSCTTQGSGAPVFLAGPAAGGPADLRGRFVALRLRVEGLARLRGLELRLSSDDFHGAFFAFPIPLYGDPYFNVIQEGAWTSYTLSFGVARTEGAPDRAAIDGIGLYVSDDGSGSVRVELAAVAAVPAPPAGVVSFTFDDGWAEHATFAAPELARFGFRGTAYVIPDSVGRPGFASEAQLAALQSDYGWDVAAHHGVSFTDLPPRALEQEILRVKRYLLARGFARGADHLAYPLGRQDPANVRPLVRAHFATARIASAGPETLPPADPHLLRAVNVLDSTTPDELVRVAERARVHGEWAILMFHHLVEEPASELDYARRDFRAALARIAASGVEVLPVSEVWDRYGETAPPPR